jgi:exodeoxyribonuclease-3
MTATRGWVPASVVLTGDYKVVPTDDDIYSPVTWRLDNALLRPNARHAYAQLLQQGWTDTKLVRAAMPDCASTISCSAGP